MGAWRSTIGREFAAWLGLTPTQRDEQAPDVLIALAADPSRRIGAQTVLLRSKAAKANPWIQNLLARCARLKVGLRCRRTRAQALARPLRLQHDGGDMWQA